MNTALKNILLTTVIALWLGFIGYSLSCFIAYLIGWPPFVAPLVFTIVAIIALVGGLAMRKKKEISSLFFVLFCSLFISSLSNTIILSVKFNDRTYRNAIISNFSDYRNPQTSVYNKWGFKIIEAKGRIQYEDDYVYIKTKTRVYCADYEGETYGYKEWEPDKDYGYKTDYITECEIIQHPYTGLYYYKTNKIISYRGYEDIDDLGVDAENNLYLDCYEPLEGHSIIRIESDGEDYEVEDDLSDIGWYRHYDSDIKGFIIKKRGERKYTFIDNNGRFIQAPNKKGYCDIEWLNADKNKTIYRCEMDNGYDEIIFIDNNYHSDIIVNNVRFVDCYDDYRTDKIYIQYYKDGLYYVRNIYSGKEINSIYKFSLDWGEKFTYYDKEEQRNI